MYNRNQYKKLELRFATVLTHGEVDQIQGDKGDRFEKQAAFKRQIMSQNSSK